MFGAGIAAAYTQLLALEIQYTMFYAVTLASASRGLWLWLLSRRPSEVEALPETSLSAEMTLRA